DHVPSSVRGIASSLHHPHFIIVNRSPAVADNVPNERCAKRIARSGFPRAAFDSRMVASPAFRPVPPYVSRRRSCQNQRL
ncbi:MAG: hypothetical protein AVDCRST_MAG87-3180, partial [uncultured Thermomicrobiales bacterium]